MLNIHPSLLPAFPGLDTHARALAAGVKLHGCTVHLVTEAMDEGPILAQAAVPVLPGDNEAALAARVLAQEHRVISARPAGFHRRHGRAARRPGRRWSTPCRRWSAVSERLSMGRHDRQPDVSSFLARRSCHRRSASAQLPSRLVMRRTMSRVTTPASS